MTFFLLTMKSFLRKQDPLFLLPIFIIVVLVSFFLSFNPHSCSSWIQEDSKGRKREKEMRLWDGLKIIDALLFLFLLCLFLFLLLSLHSFSVSLFYGSSSYSHLSLSEISGIIPPDPSFLTQPVPAPNSSLSFILFRSDFFSPTFFFEVAIRVELIIVSYHTERRTGYDIRLFFPPKKTIMIL